MKYILDTTPLEKFIITMLLVLGVFIIYGMFRDNERLSDSLMIENVYNVTDGDKYFIGRISTVNYQKHMFIILNSHNGTCQLLHHPDCSCLKKE